MQPTALIVDNDFFFVEFLADILISRNYNVVRAYDGREGIEQLKKIPVDLIFVDLLMPKINGMDFIVFAREYLAEANILLVLISGALVEQMDRIQAIGADVYIAKGPFEKTSRQVHELLDNLAENRRPPDKPDNLMLPDVLFPRQDTLELIQAVDYYQAVFENMGVGLLVLDRDSRILKVNRHAMIWLQMPLKDLLLRHAALVFPETHRKQLAMAKKEVALHAGLTKMAFPAILARRTVSVVVSCLRQHDEVRGWILAIAEVEWLSPE